MTVGRKPADKPTIDKSDTPSAMEGLDPADPHPAEEGDPYDTRRPVSSKSASPDIGPNPAKHAGTAPRRPDNASPEGKS